MNLTLENKQFPTDQPWTYFEKIDFEHLTER